MKPDYVLLSWLTPLARPLIHWADEPSVADADVKLANGRYTAGVLSRLYRRRFRSPAGAPLIDGEADRFLKTLRVIGHTFLKPFVLLRNRQRPQKRFDVAIEATRPPRPQSGGVQLVSTGQETVYTVYLRELVSRCGLADRVSLTGLTNEADLARLYADAACYVCPSPEEDYGMGRVEAMAAATLGVAWDHAGLTGSVVDGETGYGVRRLDTAAFADRVAQLVQNREASSRLGDAAQDHVRRHLTFDHHLDLLEEALLSAARR